MAPSPLSESQVGGGLFDQLPVPADATTSRVVVNNPLLRVVAFAMDAGQELTEHASSRAVVVQMVEGSVEFTVGASGVTTVVAGDVVYLAPGERHALVATTPTRFTLTMVQVGE